MKFDGQRPVNNRIGFLGKILIEIKKVKKELLPVNDVPSSVQSSMNKAHYNNENETDYVRWLNPTAALKHITGKFLKGILIHIHGIRDNESRNNKKQIQP